MQGEFEMSMMEEISFFLEMSMMEFYYVNQSIAKKFSRNLKWKVAKKLAHLCHQAVIWMLMWLEKSRSNKI